MEKTNKDMHITPEQLQVSLPLPEDVMEQLAKDTAEAGGEFQGNAGVERGIDRIQIGRAGIGRHARGGKGQARRADHLAGALEAEAHRHLHARARDVGRWRRPAGFR